MITLAGLKAKTRPLSIDIEGEPLTFRYRPNAFTPDVEAMMLAEGEASKTPAFLRVFCEVVASWELYTDEQSKQPLPLEPESLAIVPTQVLAEIMKAITADMNPADEASGN